MQCMSMGQKRGFGTAFCYFGLFLAHIGGQGTRDASYRGARWGVEGSVKVLLVTPNEAQMVTLKTFCQDILGWRSKHPYHGTP